jgi:CBS-domain-containing membrane protein
MIVKELMTAAVISAPPSMPMVEARSLMAKERIRHLPVIAPGGELLGIVTDRDVLSKLTVEEVMTRAVITVGPDRPARDAAQLMVDHQIGALPVEQSGRLVGIVTETDLLRAFIRLETSPRGGPR